MHSARLCLTHSRSSGNESSGRQLALPERQRLRRRVLISPVAAVAIAVVGVVAFIDDDESPDAVDAGVRQLRLRFA